MPTWVYDREARGFIARDRSWLQAIKHGELVIYREQDDLYVVEGGRCRLWWPGDVIERDGLCYTLPTAYHADSLDRGCAVPWRVTKRRAGTQ